MSKHRLRKPDGRLLNVRDLVWEDAIPGGRHILENYGALEDAVGAPDPPGPPGVVPGRPHGMTHTIDGGRGRVIGYGGPWFPNSRLIADYTDAEVRAWAASPAQRDMTHMWVSLSTGNRPPMRETTFHALDNRQQVLDRLDLLLELGIQPVIEGCTQEYFRQELDRNVDLGVDYLLAVGELIQGRCKLAFPFREMTDTEAHGNIPGLERVVRSNRLLRALAQAAGHAVHIGVHLRSYEAPPVKILEGIHEPYWLAQGKFRHDVRQPITLPDDDHRETEWPNVGLWLEYWATNRASKIAGLTTIAFEFFLPCTNTGDWGPVCHTVEQATADGAFLLQEAPTVVADYSGGATR